MDNKIQGAWIIHHTDKLQGVINAANDYESINLAGKCGLLLSSLAASEEHSVSEIKLNALAKAIKISRKTELPGILNELERQKLIVKEGTEIFILGLTSSATLHHTNTIFLESEPENHEIAALELSEKASELPLSEEKAKEYVGDKYKLTREKAEEFLIASGQIGFVDIESVDSTQKLVFNGNLFRRDEINKINAIYSSLSESEVRKIRELDDALKQQGCISRQAAYKILGRSSFIKLQSIGLYDVNTVSNETGKFDFVTKPSAFSRFGNSAVEDAFDLAKTFVTSLTFGMTQSQHCRGRITMIHKLMQKLIDGHWVGPATAIGQDYKILELRGVVQVKESSDNINRFSMKLLKKDVGELALKVIDSGDISTEAILNLPGASITGYVSPEQNRVYERKRQSSQIQTNVGELLNILRTD